MPQPRVQSLERALDLLEALAGADELGVSELAAQTGLVPSTAHRLLGTLVARGYAAQNPATGRYLLGYKLLELTSGLQDRLGRLRTAARPHLEAIQERDRRDDEPGRARGPQRRSTSSRVSGTRSVRLFTEIGQRDPRAHVRRGQGAARLARPRRRRGAARRRAAARLHAAHADDARGAAGGPGEDPPPRLRDRQRGARAGRRVRRDADPRPRGPAAGGDQRVRADAAHRTPTRPTWPACCASTRRGVGRRSAPSDDGRSRPARRKCSLRSCSALRPAGRR